MQSEGGTAVKPFPVGHEHHSRVLHHSKWGCAQREPVCDFPGAKLADGEAKGGAAAEAAVTSGDPSELPARQVRALSGRAGGKSPVSAVCLGAWESEIHVMLRCLATGRE